MGGEKILLHVGCGEKKLEKIPLPFRNNEWREVRLDIDAGVLPDIEADIRDMPCVCDGFADAVYSSHNVEHLYAHEVSLSLLEFHRVLKQGGYAVVVCPDLQVVAELVAQGKLCDPIYSSPAGPVAPLDILYGFRPSLERGNMFMAHRTGFTANTLGEAMSSAGFANIGLKRRGHPYYDLCAEGYKSR